MKEFLHKTHATDKTSSFKGRSTPRHTPERKRVSQSLTTPPVVQRKPQCSCDGGCPTCAGNIQTKLIQAKLTIGQPDDQYEEEADRVSDQVMRMPEPAIQRAPGCSSCPGSEEEDLIQTKPVGNRITPIIQRKGEEEPDEEDEIHAKSESNKSPPVNSGFQQRIQSAKSGGHRLGTTEKHFFESRFNRSFEDVKIHTDPETTDMAKSINAKAFTLGKDIFFGAGHYSPKSENGKHLLAHELTHVVQQKDPGAPKIRRSPTEPQISNFLRGQAIINRKQNRLDEEVNHVLEEDKKPNQMSPGSAAEVGRQALEIVGYERLMKLATDAGFLEDRSSGQENGMIQTKLAAPDNMIMRQAGAVTFGSVFGRWAVAAGIASQVDSPAPGPGDVVAIGILAVGLVVAGVAVMTSSSSSTTTTRAPARTRPRTTSRQPPSGNCNRMLTACLLTSLADLSGSVYGQSRCAFCWEVCNRQGSWPGRAQTTTSSMRCDFWNFKSTE
jgi:hypothetical protein